MNNANCSSNLNDQATSKSIDLDKLDRELDNISEGLSRDYNGAVHQSVDRIRAMVQEARGAAQPSGFCSKLESPCGDDSWGWCQACPKRAAPSARAETKAVTVAGAQVSQSSDDSERVLFEKWCAKQEWERSNQSDDWEVWQARAALSKPDAASAASANDVLNACITYVVHGDADFSGMDLALVAYFKQKVAESTIEPLEAPGSQGRALWKLVPVKPTDDMIVAFAEVWYSKIRCIDDCEMEDAYAAMLEAAPSAGATARRTPGTVEVGSQLLNEIYLYCDANANVSDECGDFLDRIGKAWAADREPLQGMNNEPVARLHVRLGDAGLVADVEVLDGTHLQAEQSPVDVYLAPQLHAS